MAQRDGITAGQLAGLNTRFQTGLSQVQAVSRAPRPSTISRCSRQRPVRPATSAVAIPFPPIELYRRHGGERCQPRQRAARPQPQRQASTSRSRRAAPQPTSRSTCRKSRVRSRSTTSSSYVNQQLSGGRLQHALPARDHTRLDRRSNQSEHTASPSRLRRVKRCRCQRLRAAPALYLAGTSGSATGTKRQSDGGSAGPPHQAHRARIGSPQSGLQRHRNPGHRHHDSASHRRWTRHGNVYVVGNATGNFGNQLNQGTQDVSLTKYDSAGNLLWTKLLGSAGSASGYALAINPKGGVVVAGSTTADLTYRRNRQRQHRQLRRDIRCQWQSVLGQADSHLEQQSGDSVQRRCLRQCVISAGR